MNKRKYNTRSTPSKDKTQNKKPKVDNGSKLNATKIKKIQSKAVTKSKKIKGLCNGYRLRQRYFCPIYVLNSQQYSIPHHKILL